MGFNYKEFIYWLKKTGLFKEILPVKTIYKRLCFIIIYAKKNIKMSDTDILSSMLFNAINQPFFDGHRAIIPRLIVENGEITIRIELVSPLYYSR